jgi:predicted DsbA family dithiol-disulfide isomerase
MDTPEPLRLYFDYVDPASFLLERRLWSLEGSLPAPLSLEPFEVTCPPAPLLDPDENAWAHRWSSMRAEGTKTGLILKHPWIVPWSRKAHELAFHAREKGCFPEIHDALFRAYLMEGQDIGRIDVLVALARKQGLDPMEAKAALDIDLHREKVEEARRSALVAGIGHPPVIQWKGRKLEGFSDAETLRTFLDS